MIDRYRFTLLGVMLLSEPALALGPDRDCTRIVSALERLACFDQAAGTPVSVPPIKPRSTVPTVTPAYAWMQRNERQRDAETLGFVMTVENEDAPVARQRVMISAPAMGGYRSRPYLTISCQFNISHLQLLLEHPLALRRVEVELLLDGRPIGSRRPWQVLEQGRVVDAGRGLPAVDLIRRMGGGSRIQLRSDEQQLDGLVFDAQGLAPMIEQERKACHW